MSGIDKFFASLVPKGDNQFQMTFPVRTTKKIPHENSIEVRVYRDDNRIIIELPTTILPTNHSQNKLSSVKFQKFN